MKVVQKYERYVIIFHHTHNFFYHIPFLTRTYHNPTYTSLNVYRDTYHNNVTVIQFWQCFITNYAWLRVVCTHWLWNNRPGMTLKLIRSQLEVGPVGHESVNGISYVINTIINVTFEIKLTNTALNKPVALLKKDLIIVETTNSKLRHQLLFPNTMNHKRRSLDIVKVVYLLLWLYYIVTIMSSWEDAKAHPLIYYDEYCRTWVLESLFSKNQTW